ncbi:uncharacterized protein ACA1_398940 [Acanthamoeba castellanii str. Neff]|uniref:DUF4326 domain-containing protein n=1 Tax=Acanthamoeba castellanii (strain ATCC 30010 / Neff) TaxID=1257118 RepID=L8HDR7_ACACF|nr:uncharacterized protein ACA1_398940 [Acanthamoeba castellanii str. Neff]ELR22908.1 hypothetical protein ACA1_398940 [Acanthamoeba castellanii str. Neff]
MRRCTFNKLAKFCLAKQHTNYVHIISRNYKDVIKVQDIVAEWLSKTEPVEGVAREKPSATTQQQAKKGARVVRLQRKGGQVVQSCDVYIGRRWTMGGWNLPQSKWANPFTARKAGSAAEAVRLYEEDHLSKRPDLLAELGELRGKTLGCWCKKKPSDPCHGDVLVRLVNATPE